MKITAFLHCINYVITNPVQCDCRNTSSREMWAGGGGNRANFEPACFQACDVVGIRVHTGIPICLYLTISYPLWTLVHRYIL